MHYQDICRGLAVLNPYGGCGSPLVAEVIRIVAIAIYKRRFNIVINTLIQLKIIFLLTTKYMITK
ncbi:hypothetical protein [Rivularia sp. UHCC 0363]|uniref:hypothetical protein n=1 Tax=Rivularia sp. UHCC 0363 TaxID=3110244 RepID=UPI002B21E8A6|nr:hypothetical protein [Rivularia sp. UHCC 0363]MEA5595369.1 hypothetical protein [Rivularia sp. UHCC 0363]